MAEHGVAALSHVPSGERVRTGSADPSGAWDQDHPPSTATTTQESGLRENRTSRLSERTEEGRKPDLLRLYTEEASNKADPVGGGERGGKAAGRREGASRRMPRTQRRVRHVTGAAGLRAGGEWATQAPNSGRVRPSTGARCGKAARRDLWGRCRSLGTSTRPFTLNWVAWSFSMTASNSLDPNGAEVADRAWRAPAPDEPGPHPCVDWADNAITFTTDRIACLKREGR